MRAGILGSQNSRSVSTSCTPNKNGFQKIRRKGIQLGIGQELTVDLMLKVREIQQQITVAEGTPQVSAKSEDIFRRR